jgi:YD repeat-containing protein
MQSKYPCDPQSAEQPKWLRAREHRRLMPNDSSSGLTTLPPTTGQTAQATASYDKAGEITSSTLSGTTNYYTYDKDGNRTAVGQFRSCGTAHFDHREWPTLFRLDPVFV